MGGFRIHGLGQVRFQSINKEEGRAGMGLFGVKERKIDEDIVSSRLFTRKNHVERTQNCPDAFTVGDTAELSAGVHSGTTDR